MLLEPFISFSFVPSIIPHKLKSDFKSNFWSEAFILISGASPLIINSWVFILGPFILTLPEGFSFNFLVPTIIPSKKKSSWVLIFNSGFCFSMPPGSSTLTLPFKMLLESLISIFFSLIISTGFSLLIKSDAFELEIISGPLKFKLEVFKFGIFIVGFKLFISISKFTFGWEEVILAVNSGGFDIKSFSLFISGLLVYLISEWLSSIFISPPISGYTILPVFTSRFGLICSSFSFSWFINSFWLSIFCSIFDFGTSILIIKSGFWTDVFCSFLFLFIFIISSVSKGSPSLSDFFSGILILSLLLIREEFCLSISLSDGWLKL